MELKESKATATFKLTSQGIEISGPPEFVERHLDKHESLIQGFFDLLKNKPVSSSNLLTMPGNEKQTIPQTIKQANEVEDTEFEEIHSSETNLQKYISVIAITNNNTQILADIPGDSLPKRMINVIMIHLWIRLQQNIETVTFNELREVCQKHGELDKGHFAAYINNNKRIFIVAGNGKSQSAKLTIPGVKETEKLLSSLKEHSN